MIRAQHRANANQRSRSPVLRSHWADAMRGNCDVGGLAILRTPIRAPTDDVKF